MNQRLKNIVYVYACRKLVDRNDFNAFKQSFDQFDIQNLHEEYYNRLLFSILKNVEFFKYALSIRDLQNYETCFLNAFYNCHKDTFEYLLNKVDPIILLIHCAKYIKDINDRFIDGNLLEFGKYDYHNHGQETEQKFGYIYVLHILSREIIINGNAESEGYHRPYTYTIKHANHFSLLSIVLNKLKLNTSFLKWVYWRCFRNVDKKYFDDFKEVTQLLKQMDQDETNMIYVIHSIITNDSLTNLPMFDANCFLKVLPFYIVYKN